MDDEPDVSLVDAHAERDGGDDDLYLVAHPLVLDLLPLLIGYLRVVVVALDQVVDFEYLRQFLALLPRQTVYDARLVVEPVLQLEHQVLVHVLELLLVPDLVHQVGPVETGLEERVALLDAQSLHDVLLHLDRGRRGQTQQGHARVPLLQEVQVQVVLAEVLAPVTHAVHLVDHEAVDVATLVQRVDGVHERGTLHQLLRGQVHQFYLQGQDLLVQLPHAFVLLGAISLGRQGARRDAQ